MNTLNRMGVDKPAQTNPRSFSSLLTLILVRDSMATTHRKKGRGDDSDVAAGVNYSVAFVFELVQVYM